MPSENEIASENMWACIGDTLTRIVFQSQLLAEEFLHLDRLLDARDEAPPIQVQTETLSAPMLSSRLAQVVRLVSLGCNNSEIGLILGLSESTVDNYRTRAMKLMGAHSSASLTRLTIKHGFSSLEDELTAEERQTIGRSTKHSRRSDV